MSSKKSVPSTPAECLETYLSGLVSSPLAVTQQVLDSVKLEHHFLAENLRLMAAVSLLPPEDREFLISVEDYHRFIKIMKDTKTRFDAHRKEVRNFFLNHIEEK